MTGYDRVLIIAVATAEGSRSEMLKHRLQSESAALDAAGAAVEAILPDADSLAALGGNLMDASQARLVANAARRQGNAEAARLRGFWQ